LTDSLKLRCWVVTAAGRGLAEVSGYRMGERNGSGGGAALQKSVKLLSVVRG
jgi:hypothetical protein